MEWLCLHGLRTKDFKEGGKIMRLHLFRPVSLILGIVLLSALILPVMSVAEEILHLYGPGGPYPAMREATAVFGKRYNVKIEVVVGPTNQWAEKAKSDADLIYSGSEYMMTDLIRVLEGKIDETTVKPLYLRPSAILVRRDNPKKIQDFPDLLEKGMKVLVVSGAGQIGLWEDVAGKQGDIETVRAFRKNISVYASDSAEAKKRWIENRELDAWLTWVIWAVSDPTMADVVPIGDEYVIYRDCGIALTHQGKAKALAQNFIEFLESAESAKVFEKWGWVTETK
jgi:accessory colonization factor AcfC